MHAAARQAKVSLEHETLIVAKQAVHVPAQVPRLAARRGVRPVEQLGVEADAVDWKVDKVDE